MPFLRKGVKRQLSQTLRVTNKRRRTGVPASNQILTNILVNNDECEVKCKYCNLDQPEDVSILPDAEHECIVLTNEVLASIYSVESNVVHHNLTNYSVYDDNNHMCSIDSGLLEKNIKLYLTGYVKPIDKFGSDIEEGISAADIGPILDWWFIFDGKSSQVILNIRTNYADYSLNEPHSSYKKFMYSLNEKIDLCSLVINKLLNSLNDEPTYKDILNCIENSVNPSNGKKFTEKDLITHAQFIIDQIVEYDECGTDTLLLADTHFIIELIELLGATKDNKVSTTSSERTRQIIRGEKSVINKRVFSKATTTELVKDVFENNFAAQLDFDNKENEATSNKCVKTVFDDEVCNTNINIESSERNSVKKNQILWNDQILCIKMFIIVKNNTSLLPLIGRIEYFLKKNNKDKIHLHLFLHSYETVQGEYSDSQEIFASKKCTEIDVSDIIGLLEVAQKIPSDNWHNLGNSKLKDLAEPVNRNNKKSFFFQQQYDDELGRFEYPRSNLNLQRNNFCINCETKNSEEDSQVPKLNEFVKCVNNILFFNKLIVNNEEYKIGNFVYLQTGVFVTDSRSNFVGKKSFVHIKSNKNKNPQVTKTDENMYPEYYRKMMENTMRGSNEKTPNPFEIGEILALYTLEDTIKITVRRMYRAEHIPLKDFNKTTDMNLLFWSEEEFRVFSEDIRGKCYVTNAVNITDPFTWSTEGPDRFYFRKKYDFSTGNIIPEYKLPSTAKLTGSELYVNFDYAIVDANKQQFIPSYKKIKPLRGLDIFAGCGGLSRGLEDSGLLKTHWAIESNIMAADAFQSNNPETTVFVEDCNNLLKLAMAGKIMNDKKQRIPQKGEVDFICGGPPCQGFSIMNRFNTSQYSNSQNSLIISYLSYIDYYRPKFFVMENVKSFVSFKKSMFFKLTIRCFIRMGYQCTFGVLQAGNFGVPQTRRRLIIMGAAPGEQLPFYPEPIHVFNKRGSNSVIQVGDKKFRTNCKYENSAPMRTVTVYDAWSDLPEILNGADIKEIPYKSDPITHFQKLIRNPRFKNINKQQLQNLNNSLVTDHICKHMSPLVQARMELIPVDEGSDWRDLPNIVVKLSDETFTNTLVYTHNDVKNGKNRSGGLRGVCQCATGAKCNPKCKQNNTIIPWSLPHTGYKNNNWAGIYGRIAWEGFCSTTTTNPEPTGKQGRVLHPVQHRIMSVRECARSQGFHDSYIFRGSITEKHCQIGNAVPPPMAKAIGHEFIKVINDN